MFFVLLRVVWLCSLGLGTVLRVRLGLENRLVLIGLTLGVDDETVGYIVLLLVCLFALCVSAAYLA
jgi:hypothetical protein